MTKLSQMAAFEKGDICTSAYMHTLAHSNSTGRSGQSFTQERAISCAEKGAREKGNDTEVEKANFYLAGFRGLASAARVISTHPTHEAAGRSLYIIPRTSRPQISATNTYTKI